MSISIALVGDYSKHVIVHTAIPLALELAASTLNTVVKGIWIETTTINDTFDFSEFAAIWLTPGSPYKNMAGALTAVRFARETKRPFLGTCGGFQHALIEYARNICAATDANHAETSPESDTLIITPLLCSLVGKTADIFFTKNSQLNAIFKEQQTTEAFHCNYGLNPEWKTRLEANDLNFTGFDVEDQVRAFELTTHPFFIGTLFQPERSALRGKQHPLINAFIKAATECF